jgi:hypothetical protein
MTPPAESPSVRKIVLSSRRFALGFPDWRAAGLPSEGAIDRPMAGS